MPLLALHASWTPDDRLDLWAEDPALLGRALRSPLRPSHEKNPIQAHPYAVSGSSLQQALGVGLLGEPSDLLIALPSLPACPLPSPTLIREDSVEITGSPSLRPWTVPTLSLDPGLALDLLLGWRSDPPPGLLRSDSLSFFSSIALFALELCARGSLVPSLVRTTAQGLDPEPPFEARWRPWTSDDDDLRRLEALAKAAPAVTRALLPSGVTAERLPDLRTWGGTRARELVEAALFALVDEAARAALRGRSLLKGRKKKRLSVNESWLEALCAEDPEVEADPAALQLLARSLETWARPQGDPASAFRTCFRLSPPSDGGSIWEIEFLLQARDDPSLLVSAREIWAGREALLVLGQRYLQDPQEHLLGDLGRALRLFPPLEGGLRTARPSSFQTDAATAWRFLHEGVPLLSQAGFGTILPPWWGTPAARLGARLSLSPKKEQAESAGALGVNGLVAFRWDLAIGDTTLSHQEFRRIAALKMPFVQVRGQWVELRPEDIAAASRLFDKKALEGDITLREALRLGVNLGDRIGGLGVLGLEAEGWLGDLLAEAREARVENAPTPVGFRGTLRPYQERGLAWLDLLDRFGLGGILADDMGLGKTIQLLALLVRERVDGHSPGPTLLVCPMSVVGNWLREAGRFAPSLRVYVHHGASRVAAGALRALVAQSDLVLTTYALATRDREALGAVTWRRLVLDEAQNIKNAETLQARALRSIPAQVRVALTGTPVENRLSELWSIMEFLNPGLLGSQAAFRREFSIPVERYSDSATATRLRSLTRPFILRRLKTDRSIIQDLPDKIEMKVLCNLSSEQATLYQAALDEMLGQIEASTGIQRRGLILATLTRLKQICNHPAQYLKDHSAIEGRSGKLARLEETLEEALANGEKALIFTQFAEMGRLLRARLQDRLGREVLFLHGAITAKARDEMVRRFQEPSGPPLFLLSLKAGGTGLNLTAASHVVHFDRWWNPAVEDQATDRAFRIGQTRKVQVRKLVCVGTLEERIDQMIEDKRSLAGQVVGEGEAWISELSDTELRTLCALSTDAVAED